MPFRFIHTADWQIGKPFRSFPERVSALLEDHRYGIVDRLAECARSQGAEHVLVAGDVFDADLLPERTILRLMERVKRADGLTFHLLPGNHDPVRPGSLWNRLARGDAPANVRLHLAPAPAEIAPGVWLLPAPLETRSRPDDPTAWMDSAPTPDGAIRIGLAHGSVHAFGEEGEAKIPIAADRARRARLDYLALGDWHGTVAIDDRTWYAGTPEPDRYKDNEAGQALAVAIAGAGAAPDVRRLRTAHCRWIGIDAVVSDPGQIEALQPAIFTAGHPPDRTLARIKLSGSVPLEAHAELDRWREGLEARLFHVEIDIEGLAVDAAATPTGLADAPAAIAAAARELERIAASGSSDARIARHALVRLARYRRALSGSLAR